METNYILCDRLLVTNCVKISDGFFAKLSVMYKYNSGSSLELSAFFIFILQRSIDQCYVA